MSVFSIVPSLRNSAAATCLFGCPSATSSATVRSRLVSCPSRWARAETRVPSRRSSRAAASRRRSAPPRAASAATRWSERLARSLSPAAAWARPASRRASAASSRAPRRSAAATACFGQASGCGRLAAGEQQLGARAGCAGGAERKRGIGCLGAALGRDDVAAVVEDHRAQPSEVPGALRAREPLGRLRFAQRAVELERQQEVGRAQLEQLHQRLLALRATGNRERAIGRFGGVFEALELELRARDPRHDGQSRGQRRVVELAQSCRGAVDRSR